MSVRIKMKLMSVAPLYIGDPHVMGSELYMTPLTDDKNENISGTSILPKQCVVAVTDPTVAQEFEVGKDYYLEITPTS